MIEVSKAVTLKSASGLAQAALQNELQRLNTLCKEANYKYQGSDEPGYTLHLDGVTLNNVKFIYDVAYDEQLSGSNEIDITIDYVAYEE